MIYLRLMRIIAIAVVLAVTAGMAPLCAQEEEEGEGIIWGEEEEGFDEDFFGEDEEFFDEEFFDEGEELFEDEFGVEEEFGDELDEFLEEDEEPEEAFVDQTGQEIEAGWNVNIALASPAFANSTLATWNSFVNFRASVDTPFLLELGPVVMRFGAEINTFKFDNYLPEGGKFSGVGLFGTVVIPSGASQLEAGIGIVGTSPAVMFGQSFGMRLNNEMEMRFGFRSTTALTVPDQLKNYGTTSGWLSGNFAINYEL